MIKIHFLNVGHGDCIVIQFPERLSVIDINRSEQMDEKSFDEIMQESFGTRYYRQRTLYSQGSRSYNDLLIEAKYNIKLTDPIPFIKSISAGSQVFRFISTHPHMDHLSGLSKFKDEIGIVNFWVINNNYEPDLKELSDEQKNDWKLYTEFRTDSNKTATILHPIEKELNDFWKQDNIKILAPNKRIFTDEQNPNAMSYVLLIEYAGHKIVLGGDADISTWDYLVESYPDMLKDTLILKASHHGRDSGYHQDAVKLMNPEFTIVSVGKKPETDASQKYKQYSKHVFSTRWHGTICFQLNDDGTGTYTQEYDRN